MIRFPLFERLVISGYGLYPGTQQKPGLDVAFGPGLTMVLGANGLGKTTLVLALYRMCTGPNDLAGWTDGDLGNRQLRISPLALSDRRAFASRVNDQASRATAMLQFRLGASTFQITRNLRNLDLTELIVDDNALRPDEDSFKAAIIERSGLTNFADWILVLRYLTFYFEDRRSLVWDPTAQRQLMRFLFLSPEDSDRWTKLEQAVLSLDSRYRNLHSAISREESHLQRQERTVTSAPETRARIAELTRLQEVDRERLQRAEEQLPATEAERSEARLSALRAAEDRESAYRALERRRFAQLQEAFPTDSQSAAYILGHLLASEKCLVCESTVPEFAAQITTRVDEGLCVVCSSPVPVRNTVIADADDNAEDLEQQLRHAEVRLEEANKRRDEAENAYQTLVRELAELSSTIDTRSSEINMLVSRLPQQEQSAHERRNEFNALRANLAVLRTELDRAREEYGSFVRGVYDEILARQDNIKSTFDDYARDFLLESCELKWAKQPIKVGQIGDPVEFGAFRVDMTGTDFGSAVRRTASDQVSESQREFIDLAFRMALIATGGEDGVGSLVIDAPESSLDAVFAPRAARVLMRFGTGHNANRLVVTSNLVEGRLIPTMLGLANITAIDDNRIVNLFDIATPTAAISVLHSEYRSAIAGVLNGGGQ